MIAIFKLRIVRYGKDREARIEQAWAPIGLAHLTGSYLQHERFAAYTIDAVLYARVDVFRDSGQVDIRAIVTNNEMRELAQGVDMTIEELVQYMINEGNVHILSKGEKTVATPTIDKSSPLFGYHISADIRLTFNTVHQMSLRNPEQPVKVAMVGASGFGKTMMPELFAKLTGRKFFRMNCPSVRDPEEWFGWREAKEGSTVFVPSKFIEIVTAGNAVIVLDEFNRLEPWLHNTLYPLLDDAAATEIHDQIFKVGPGVIFVGTFNTGYKYTGTFELDEALANRFNFFIEVKAMQERDEVKVLVERTGLTEEQATTVVKIANLLRGADINCSTRSTLDLAKQVMAGMTVREAYEFGVIRRIPQSSDGGGQRKQALDLINAKIGHYVPRPLTKDIFGNEVKEEPKKDEDKATVGSLTLKRNAKVEYLNVNVVRALRQLPLNASGDDVLLKDAQKISEQILAGDTVIVALHRSITNLSEIVTVMERCGCSVTLNKGGK